GAERLLELGPAAQLPEELVGVEQVLVVEDDVVDADDLVLAQLQIGQTRAGLEQVHAQGVVRVVVEVRAGRDDPVDEPGLDQRDEAAHAEAGRRERSAERQPDRAVAGEHLAGEELAALAEPAGVVREERGVEQVGGGDVRGDGRRVDLLPADLVQELLVLGGPGVAVVVLLVWVHVGSLSRGRESPERLRTGYSLRSLRGLTPPARGIPAGPPPRPPGRLRFRRSGTPGA